MKRRTNEDRRARLTRHRDNPARPLPPPSPEELAERDGLDFPEALTLARRQAVLTRAELAVRLGCGQMMVWRWETQGERPSRDMLARLFKLLGPLPLGRHCECPYCGQNLPESRKFKATLSQLP